MRNVRTYTVVPALPERLSALRDIACNLWWSWTRDARQLFIDVGREQWEACGHNPLIMLGRVSPERLKQLSEDAGFLAVLDRVKSELDAYMAAETWHSQLVTTKNSAKTISSAHTATESASEVISTKPANSLIKPIAGLTDKNAQPITIGGRVPSIAYFSAEFGLHECLPIYSGGLGLLAGDHLKAASALGIPLVAMGLFYYNGYFRQYLNHEGFQQEYLYPNDFYNLPCELQVGKDGKPIMISVDFPGRKVWAQIWRVQVGRIPLFLLDTKIDANSGDDRAITDQLYGGDHEHRLKQEILLGVGGIRALRALGREPEVVHMNEGHAAFSAIERMRILIEEKGLQFHEALEAGVPGNIFTTHTPVPAGNEVFGTDLMDRYFGEWHAKLHIDRKSFLALGRVNPHDEGETFSMTILALRTSGAANGVSKLHGDVSRQMWASVWPDVPVHEVPIGHITNGCHIRSYVSDQLDELFVRYCGPRWSLDAWNQGTAWRGPDQIPDSELWRVHERRRSRLVTWARERVKSQLKRAGASPRSVEEAEEILDPEVLTIGFARRFATYKRGTLLFRDPERLAQILSDKDRRVQILYAGKAHPKDNAGKQFIQAIYKFARDPRFKNRIIFLEDYDITVARYLVQGVDVWLNTPRRPMEASGTSGMKAAANGALNCSILDGWWCEGYDGENGWGIGAGEDYTDLEYQDDVESRALYDLLEKHIVPLFYERRGDGLPREWIRRMKRAMMTAAGTFSTFRMVQDYYEKYYSSAGESWLRINGDNLPKAKELWQWKLNLFANWAQIRVEDVVADKTERLSSGAGVKLNVRMHLGPIRPEDVDVQAYYGRLNDRGGIDEGQSTSLACKSKVGDAEGSYQYSGEIPCASTGRFGYEIRAIPKNPNLKTKFIPSLITWG